MPGMASPRKKLLETDPLHYPSSMSLYERESLAAEAKLLAEKKKKKHPSSRKSTHGATG
jgi:hypothetical protein